MNTRLVNTAADVINAALTQDRTAAGIALALESAQLLMSPETAAELETLRARVAELEAAPTPAVGDRYVKRAAPDKGRVVTVTRVWTADDGHTAVAYEWREPRVSSAFSACPLYVFHRTYVAEAGGAE